MLISHVYTYVGTYVVVFTVKYDRCDVHCECIGSLLSTTYWTEHSISEVVNNLVKLGNQLVHYMFELEAKLWTLPLSFFRFTGLGP